MCKLVHLVTYHVPSRKRNEVHMWLNLEKEESRVDYAKFTNEISELKPYCIETHISNLCNCSEFI